MTLGVDVGGTFTDLAWWDGSALRTSKLSTTADQSDGVAAGVEQLLGPESDSLLLHGTTVATNALLEGRGARVALVTNAGFEHLLEIARQDRPSLYDSMADRPPALAEPHSRIGWPSTEPLADLVAASGAEAVAIGLLGSYRDGTTEDDVASLLPGYPRSLSHRVSPEFREYERVATTVLNAYLQPVVARYLEGLRSQLTDLVDRVLVLRSSGGLTSLAGATDLAASILLSGPAGGVVAAAACGSSHGWERIISFDMGGTSTDVCRVEGGRPEVLTERTLEGFTCRLPSVAIHTIGAGGGSIAWADHGGALRVGPQSAGSHPGPSSYGRGGQDPTVTDANLLAGRLGPEVALAGGLTLDSGAALVAIDNLATALSSSPVSVAAGILEVVDTLMERALRRVSVEQGADPRQAALIAFGGAGGLHATSLARGLDMPAVLVPPHAGVFSALGLLLSPARHDLTRTIFIQEGDETLADVIDQQLASARSEFEAQVGYLARRVEITVDMRYPGQSFETSVSHRPGEGWEPLAVRFHEAHAALNGFARFDNPVELVTVRVTALADPALGWSDLPEHRPTGEVRLPDRQLPGGEQAARWRRRGIDSGQEVAGPAVIEDEQSTTWIGPGERALVLADGTLEVTW
ncbi:MAG TPA: hydantoinase/oxoprolinase family protein [Acidimicrobiia bacterium]|nr:hydantoinase/oxoprolinase family protein [Acidimicrobiia bacterium]